MILFVRGGMGRAILAALPSDLDELGWTERVDQDEETLRRKISARIPRKEDWGEEGHPNLQMRLIATVLDQLLVWEQVSGLAWLSKT